MPSEADDRLEGRRLSVRFVRAHDRYAHEVWLAGPSGPRCLLRSMEGTPHEEWPPSPPLQSLEIERRAAERQVALLVGMAGRSHWSASVELDALGDRVRFEMACRAKGTNGLVLGSRYQLADERSLRATALDEHSLIVSDTQATGVALRLDVDEHFAGMRILVAPAATILIEPATPPALAEATTIRWAYTIALSPIAP